MDDVNNNDDNNSLDGTGTVYNNEISKNNNGDNDGNETNDADMERATHGYNLGKIMR